MIRFTTAFFLLGTMVLLGFISSCSTGKTSQKSPLKPFPENLIEKANTWRGGVVGGSLGIPIDGKIKEISAQASREAAREGKPVAYLSLDGFQRVESFPVDKGGSTPCRKVRVKIFQEAKLIWEAVKEVCQ